MKVGFIGTGNMGGAILKCFAKSDLGRESDIYVLNRNAQHNREMAKAAGTGIVIPDDCEHMAELADIIVIGVKPKDIDEVLDALRKALDRRPADAEKKLIVSMAAGVSIEHIEAKIGSGGRVLRIMPNTPAQVGQAMTSITRGTGVTGEELADITEIFETVGRVEEVPEDMIDCVIGVSGSSPAYTYMYIQALAEAAAANGMTPDKARKFAAQAVLGAAEMVLHNERETLEQLRINVCSPGGTTIEAVNALRANGFMDDVREGFQAAVDRSIEMTRDK